MLGEISDIDTRVNDEIRSLFSQDDPEEELGVAIDQNSVSKYSDGKTPEDLTKRWPSKTGKPKPDKHQRGNNPEPRVKDDGKDKRYLTTLYDLSVVDALEEREQKNSEWPRLTNPGDSNSDEQLQEMLERDYSFEGNLENWKNHIDYDDDSGEDSNHGDMTSEDEARKLLDGSRRERYFGKGRH